MSFTQYIKVQLTKAQVIMIASNADSDDNSRLDGLLRHYYATHNLFYIVGPHNGENMLVYYVPLIH